LLSTTLSPQNINDINNLGVIAKNNYLESEGDSTPRIFIDTLGGEEKVRSKIIDHLTKFNNTNNLNDLEWNEVISLLHKLAIVYSENSGKTLTMIELYNDIAKETRLNSNNLIRAYFDKKIQENSIEDSTDSFTDAGE
jgi:hypothetical protein